MAETTNDSPVVAGTPDASAAPDLRVTSQPAPLQFAEGIWRGLGRTWDEDRVKTLLSELAGRKRSIESVLLEVAKSAQDSTQDSFDQTRETLRKEQHLTQQYRDQLVASKAKARRARARRGEVRVSGQVLHPTTGKPVPGVVVEAVDRDPRARDSAGGAITDDQGKFTIAFHPKDDTGGSGREPEIMLRVGTDRSSLRSVSEQPLPWAEVETGAITVTLTETAARNMDILAMAQARHADTRVNRAKHAVLQQELDILLLDGTGASLGELLAQGIALLEERMKEPVD